jgi:outer membrane protein assembly factor BamD (BamD/ComL family)
MPDLTRALVRGFLAGLLLVLVEGCSFLKAQPVPILPPDELYKAGENEFQRRRYDQARKQFKSIVERHPNSSYAARARFLIGES